MVFRPIHVVLGTFRIEIGEMDERAGVDRVAPWITPGVGGVLVGDDVGAFHAAGSAIPWEGDLLVGILE